MGITWLVTYGKTAKQTADLEVCYSKGKCPQFSFNFSKGAYATKLKNAERVLVGMDENETRVYFAPAEGKLGYKVTSKPSSNKAYVFVTASKMQAAFPTLPPSSVIGTYDLKYDMRENLYYISIGALPR